LPVAAAAAGPPPRTGSFVVTVAQRQAVRSGIRTAVAACVDRLDLWAVLPDGAAMTPAERALRLDCAVTTLLHACIVGATTVNHLMSLTNRLVARLGVARDATATAVDVFALSPRRCTRTRRIVTAPEWGPADPPEGGAAGAAASFEARPRKRHPARRSTRGGQPRRGGGGDGQKL